MSPSLLLGSVIFLVLCTGVFGPLQALRPHHGQRQRWSVIVIASGLFVFNQQLIELCGPPLIALLSGWLGHVAAPVTTSAMIGRIALLLVLIDLGEYALHRAMHAHPLLWRLHRVHHQPEVVTWQVAWYQHPADALLHALLAGVLGVLLGVDLSAIVGLVLLRKLWTGCLHADVDLRLGWAGRIIATPAFHRLHHGRCHNRNFSATFPLWDRLLGTWMESHVAEHDTVRPAIAT